MPTTDQPGQTIRDALDRMRVVVSQTHVYPIACVIKKVTVLGVLSGDLAQSSHGIRVNVRRCANTVRSEQETRHESTSSHDSRSHPRANEIR